jgi:hypothetical protein
MKTPAEWSLEFGKLCAAKGCDFLCREHVEEAFAEAQREARAEAFEEAAQLLWERTLPTDASYDIAKAIRALAAKVTP